MLLVNERRHMYQSQLRLVATVACLSLFLGCSGSGSSSAKPAPGPLTPPSVSNFVYLSASTWTVGDGGGSVSGSFGFDFTDAGGDFNTVVTEYLDGSGMVAKSSTWTGGGMSGMTSGTVHMEFKMDTTTVGTFNWRFRLVDARGSVSNNVNSSYTITP
jgi:hypothetical protein